MNILQNSILTIDHLEIGHTHTILGPLTIAVPSASFVLVEGPNGAGKSTLLKTLLGLLPARGGAYHWSVEPRALRFVPQTRTLDVLLPATVQDVMRTGLLHGARRLTPCNRSWQHEIDRALTTVDMRPAARALFRELSEGQKQLILLGRALLGHPAAILLDEPTASMDPHREQRTIDILKQQQESGTTILIIAHGSQPAREAADHLLTLDNARHATFTPTPRAAAPHTPEDR